MSPRFWAKIYGAALLVLPQATRGDRADMASALEEQLRGAGSRRAATSALLRALLRLPAVALAEWMEVLRPAARSPRGVFAQNLRFAARTLRKNPTFTWVSVLLIGLGVGAVTTVFTVVDHVLLRPLPYPDQERLTYLTRGSHNGPTLRALDDVESFDLWVTARSEDANLTRVGAEPLRLSSVQVTASFFPLFGARPLVGRVLLDDDDADLSVAVLAYDAWISIWGGDRSIVGSTIQLNAEPVTIVGVLAPEFVAPERLVGRGAHLYRPMNWTDPRLQSPGYHAHSVAARLAGGVDLSAAQAELDRVYATLQEQDLLTTSRDEPWPLVPLKDVTVQNAREGLILLLASVGLLLLVACANVALLFMARGLSRVREMSVRRSLGAGTRILLGQLATESLLVGLAGGLLGIALAHLGLAGFDRWIGDLPRSDAIVMDARVLLFTIALSTATALVFGLAPALRAIGQDVAAQLRESGRAATESRRVRWVRGGLIAGEVGVSLVLVALAGLLLRSFLGVTARDPGIEPSGVWVVALNTPDLDGDAAADEFRRRMGAVLAAIEATPGVSSATWGIEMPFENVGGSRCCWSLRTAPVDVADLGSDERSAITYLHAVTDDFFETLGTGIVAGMSWTAGDAVVAPFPVVLTESLAIRHFGSAEAAIGQQLQVWRIDEGNGPVRVVGVAEPTLHYGLDQIHPDAMYVPVEALPWGTGSASFAVQVPSAPAGIVVASIRDAIWSVEPSLPVPSVVTLESMIDDSSTVRRLSSALSSAFGAIALLLAAGGLYGTLLYTASQRRRELGIRIALGAGRRRIQSDVVVGGVRLAVVGLVLGLPAAIYLGRLLEDFLWNVAPTDAGTLVTAATVLLAAAALASWLPAYRASRTDPLEVLRSD